MVDAAAFIKSARSFVDEQSQVFGKDYLKIRDECEANLYTAAIGGLMGALEWTTESIFILTENEHVWDLPILFRSVLEGSARAMYLISAPSKEEGWKRADEYANILLKAEMASMEQSVNRMTAVTRDDGEANMEIAQDIIQTYKTGDGEGRKMQQISKRWNFWNISRVLRKECRQWACAADTWELQYAAANGAIHKSNLSNVDGTSRYRSIRDGKTSPLLGAATPVQGCVELQFDRLFLYSMRLGFDPSALIDVKSRHEDFFDMVAEIRAESKKNLKAQLEPPR